VLTINEAIQQGLINTTTSESLEHRPGGQEPPGESPRIPVGDFGIDKHVKSIRTKFNKDGTSVLQIDIESTKPTRGIFEIDEIEEFTLNQRLASQPAAQVDADSVRQVVDINSVQTVRQPVSPPRRVELLECNLKKEREQRVYEAESEIGGELSIRRIEDVIDDCDDSESLVRKRIIERQVGRADKPVGVQQSIEQRVLVIDDINEPRRAVNINGVLTSTRNEELHISESSSANGVLNEERLRRIVESTTELNHQHLHRLSQLSHHAATHVGEVTVRPTVHEHVVVDLGFEKRDGTQRVEACDIPYETTTTTTRKEVFVYFKFISNN
jgi:hypothetical protein